MAGHMAGLSKGLEVGVGVLFGPPINNSLLSNHLDGNRGAISAVKTGMRPDLYHVSKCCVSGWTFLAGSAA